MQFWRSNPTEYTKEDIHHLEPESENAVLLKYLLENGFAKLTIKLNGQEICSFNGQTETDANINLGTGGTRSCASVAVAQERDPPEMSDFEKRLRLAIAGNILDFSVYADLDIAAAMETMKEAFTKPICGALGGARFCATAAETAAPHTDAQECVPSGDIVAELKRRMDEAKSILWIFDNCGEAVFDRLLMEPYRDKITLAVRGKPAFNDLTRAELSESGYPEGFSSGGVVSNDDGVPGVVDETCGAAFRAAFAAADLVVAKGQANFETMSERTDKPIAFLFLAKCPVVCREVGAQPQTIQVVLHNFERTVEK